MTEPTANEMPQRFRRKSPAPRASHGWRWLFPAALLAAMGWAAMLLIESAHELLDSQDGEIRTAQTDPTSLGFEAFVEQTWSMLIITENKNEDLTDLAVATVADRENGGGSILLVPPHLRVAGGCAMEPCDLAALYKEGGQELLTEAMVSLLNVGFTQEVLLTESRWAGLTGPVGGVTVSLPAALTSENSEGEKITHFEAGKTLILPNQTVGFLDFSEGLSGSNDLALSQAFWSSWLAKLSESENPLDKLPALDLDVVELLAMISAGNHAVVPLLVSEADDGLYVEADLLAQIVVEMFPFPISAHPGDRVSVRLINGTGDFTTDPVARQRVVAAGGEIIVVGNHPSFDVAESIITYRDPSVAVEATTMAQLLGIPAEYDAFASPAAEITVLIGADFVGLTG